MSISKYDSFWKNKLELISLEISQAAKSNIIGILDFPDIKDFGQRQSWAGRVVLSDGEIISGGEMAHMKSLGRLVSIMTNEFPSIVFRFSMNNQCELTIGLETAQEEHTINKTPKAEGKGDPLPYNCAELHQYVWELQRYKYPVDGELFPKNGIYFQFEAGEQAHGGDRIVRVGTHREPDRLEKRIETNYTGSRANSVFRSHIGDALSCKYGRKVTEVEISDYIHKKFSFSVFCLE